MSDGEWKLGDVVELKSGGPDMTVVVVKLANGLMRCGYMHDDEYRTIEVPREAVQIPKKKNF